MYVEEYEKAKFPFRKFIVRLLIIVIIALGGIWAFTHFFQSEQYDQIINQCITRSEITDARVRDNVNTLRDVSLTYFNEERINEEVRRVSFEELINEGYLETLFNERGVAYNTNSYLRLVEDTDGFQLVITLNVNDESECIRIPLVVSGSCETYLCVEKETTEIEEVQNEEEIIVEEVEQEEEIIIETPSVPNEVVEEVNTVSVPNTSTFARYENVVQFQAPIE